MLPKINPIFKIILILSLVVCFGVKARAGEIELQELESRLKNHVVEISDKIGERNYWFYKNLTKTASYIRTQFKEFGYKLELQPFTTDDREFFNIIATKKGETSPEEIIVVGAHYDTIVGSPGADDNASGVAGLLELARIFSKQKTQKTIKFIAFTNEEPPYFETKDMGSIVYAKSARKKSENIVAMICLEMIGYYNKEENSQSYPLLLGLFYPNRANFIGLVSNLGSLSLVNKLKRAFRKHSDFALEVITAPSIVRGVDWSDHSSFWKYGYKAIMITDTSFYRYPHYHSMSDTYANLDYQSMARVVDGLYHCLVDLANFRK